MGWRNRALSVLKVLAVLLFAGTAMFFATVAVARAMLPKTCAVTEAQFEKLSMQMSYDKAKELFGCDGALESKEDYGTIVVEHYAWRGSVWPYGRVRAEFVNNTLQATEKFWLNLSPYWHG
jgi:hypothetical protein